MVTYDNEEECHKHDVEQKKQDTKGYKPCNFFHIKFKREKKNYVV